MIMNDLTFILLPVLAFGMIAVYVLRKLSILHKQELEQKRKEQQP